MKVGIINIGMGNLGSVHKAFDDIGAEVLVANHPAVLYEVNRIVLPGVGAFSEGMKNIRQGGWLDPLNELVMHQKKPLLGICLGMQMLASIGEEGGETEGLNFIPGKVKRIDALGCRLRIPHMGWNEVRYSTNDVMFAGIPESSDFYFVHSFAFAPDKPENLVATVEYGCLLAAAIRKEHVFGCQFHPEKSSKAGRQLLINFMNYIPC